MRMAFLTCAIAPNLVKWLWPLTDPEAQQQAQQEAEAARLQRGCDATVAAAAFQRGSSETLTKLARYETSIERSLYRALHEHQRLQAARAGGKARLPVTVDVDVDAGQSAA